MSRKLFSFRLDENGIEQLRKEADRVGISLTELVSRRLFSESETSFEEKKSKSIDQNNQKNLEQHENQFPNLENLVILHEKQQKQINNIEKKLEEIKTKIN